MNKILFVILLISSGFEIFSQNSFYLKESIFIANTLDSKFNSNDVLEYYDCKECNKSIIHQIGYSREFQVYRIFDVKTTASINFHSILLSHRHKIPGSYEISNNLKFHGVFINPQLELYYNLTKNRRLSIGCKFGYVKYISRTIKSNEDEIKLLDESWNDYFFKKNFNYGLGINFKINTRLSLEIDFQKYTKGYRNIQNQFWFSFYQKINQFGITLGYNFGNKITNHNIRS